MLKDPQIRFWLYIIGAVVVAAMLLVVFASLLFGFIKPDAVNAALVGVGAVVTWLLGLAAHNVPDGFDMDASPGGTDCEE